MGAAFGADSPALVDGTNLLAASRILPHSPTVALKRYNRADALEASRRHAEYVDATEDAAARMLRQGKAKPSQAEAGALPP